MPKEKCIPLGISDYSMLCTRSDWKDNERPYILRRKEDELDALGVVSVPSYHHALTPKLFVTRIHHSRENRLKIESHSLLEQRRALAASILARSTASLLSSVMCDSADEVDRDDKDESDPKKHDSTKNAANRSKFSLNSTLKEAADRLDTMFADYVDVPIDRELPIPKSVPGDPPDAERKPGMMPPWAPEDMRACHYLIRYMTNAPEAMAFLEPVDPVSLRIPLYPVIVKHPMDLGKIRLRLELYGIDNPGQRGYKTIEECARDVRLMFNNASTFNPRGDKLHAYAIALLHVFEDHYARITQDPALFKHGPVEASRLHTEIRRAVESVLKKQREEDEREKAIVATRTRSSSTPQPLASGATQTPSTPGLKRPSARIDSPSSMNSVVMMTTPPGKKYARPSLDEFASFNTEGKRMTEREKSRLCEYLARLPADIVSNVVVPFVSRINEDYALSLEHAKMDLNSLVEIDLDSMDQETLRGLTKIVIDETKKINENDETKKDTD